MTVKLPCLLPRKQRLDNTTSIRTKRALSTARSRIKCLQLSNTTLKRKNWALQKKLGRISKAKQQKSPSKPKTSGQSCSTPRSKAKKVLRSSGISPRKVPFIQRRLELLNVMMDEVKESCKTQKSAKTKLDPLRVISGKVVKKYRLVRKLGNDLQMNRKGLDFRKGKAVVVQVKKRLFETRARLKRKVASFFEEDDNSICLPGKADTKTVGREKLQKRVLNDYLHNLHQKYLAQNPEETISLSVFCRLRPKHILLASFGSRKTCLCQKHENMCLKLKALKALCVTTTTNADAFVRENTTASVIEKLEKLPHEQICFAEWKRVDVSAKGRTFKRMKIVQCEESRYQFIEKFQTELNSFREHVQRVAIQYAEIRRLKQVIPSKHAICQMDFAENYTCANADEVQSAYFDKGMVTLHPVVLYFRCTDDAELTHKSFVFVSDETAHNAATVYAFLQELIPKIKDQVPGVEVIHYITDSPTSQYRNKSIFYTVSEHHNLYGITATWTYMEAGHGKGPCDGVGGTAKRMADEAIKRQKVIIQDAEDFFTWGKGSGSAIEYIFVPKSSCERSQSVVSAMPVQPVKGTMKIHAVVPIGNSKIMTRSTSCFCKDCFASDGNFNPDCSGWEEHSILSSDAEKLEETPSMPEREYDQKTFQVGDFVAAVYNKSWFVGKVIEHDEKDGEYNITFMQNMGSRKAPSFKWPSRSDIVWVESKAVLCGVDEPQHSGTSKRSNKLSPPDLKKVFDCFEAE